MCGRGSVEYCAECQGKCDKSCDLCGFAVCQHHGDECAACGMKTCGIHDCGPRACGGCKKSYCERCEHFSCCPYEPCWTEYCSHCYDKRIQRCSKCKVEMGCASCLSAGPVDPSLELVCEVCEDCFSVLESDEDDDGDADDDEHDEHGDGKEEEYDQE
jgi:hypothetical protein